MRYVGGKHRIADWIVDNISPFAVDCQHYLEPFVGSGAVFERVATQLSLNCTVSDSHEDLILMWQALADGWIPPEHVTKEEYKALQTSTPSALRGFVGYGASFGGKWFGGYVDSAWDAYHGRFTKPYLAAARRSVLRAAPLFSKATILHCAYSDHSPVARTLVYCDPPYAGVMGYRDSFDSARFWSVAEGWARAGAIVVVSESSAPKHWTPIATKQRKHMLQVAKNGVNDLRTESLWMLADAATERT